MVTDRAQLLQISENPLATTFLLLDPRYGMVSRFLLFLHNTCLEFIRLVSARRGISILFLIKYLYIASIFKKIQ
jgi:hypothetical protein